MDIKGSAALVTGANRGIGLAFARALLAHGAAKVYAGVRDPESMREPGVTPLRLDVTDEEQVAAAARTADDVTIVINNAGVAGGPALLEGSFDGARREMEVNYFGTWAVSRAFAPVLAANGGGALVTMLSVASWVANRRLPSYAASKSAQWSLTNAFRLALREQGTLVVGVHAGYVDTDLAADIDSPKILPADVAEMTMAALLDDAPEVLADDVTRRVRAALSGDLETLYAGR
ncbi:NAD(P)-dependent dehydrogenase, short-chain alcohol dehydrogenase family [Streptomyces sp. 1222.5]|uniref:SDR family oxidoreductase n=1 Tax=unclassified Streptomyces TaxID=2593676 RepID=UPI000897F852|nr:MULTISPECIES: SDR family oxidoreductase [unclassified Streptomyces]PKW12159.1 NAD(P)-dependent dehydrogenase (short-subunit alcohol dehydrogenase family) [Streptomyces sp. 5112.2]SEB61498.1 NAD(P)-dependent dehydrogenase, short-chain alcohol dehydrogenase family [Streptomyces sp. 1222.5]